MDNPHAPQHLVPAMGKMRCGERVRFEVAGGDYRMVLSFDWRRSIAFIKFIKFIGLGQSRATEILGRHRALTLPMIRKIAGAWHVPEKVLVQEYALAKAG